MTPYPVMIALFMVGGTAQAACTLSTSGLAFGVYNPSATGATEATGTVTLTCMPGSGFSGYTIKLSIGGGASYATRRMSSGANLLSYQLFTDAARTRIWGDATNGTFQNSGSNFIPTFGGIQAFQVYGRIPALQVVSPGAYSDVIIATLTY